MFKPSGLNARLIAFATLGNAAPICFHCFFISFKDISRSFLGINNVCPLVTCDISKRHRHNRSSYTLKLGISPVKIFAENCF